jgi:tetratricopeptide (TPR) repeat protein
MTFVFLRALPLTIAIALTFPYVGRGASRQLFPADDAHEEAQRLLSAGDGAAAEAAARKAIELSSRFEPEREIGERPEKGLLFDEMIARARGSYRARRARYFRSLGDALALQERFPEARKAYSRSVGLIPAPELYLEMADGPDLPVGERVARLLDAYLVAPPREGRGTIETKLLETGAFRNRNALKASLDRKRFADFARANPGVELLNGAFGALLLTTDAGTIPTAERFAAGARLVVYVPTEGCSRCSEELDGLTHLAEEARGAQSLLDVVAFVPDADLPIARRIARLMAMPIGVARRELVPDALETTFVPSGEVRVVARGGLVQIRLPLSESMSSHEIRRGLERVFEFLDEPGLPTEEEPELASRSLVDLAEESSDRRTLLRWMEALERLEAGPAPLDDLYERLNRIAQRASRSRDTAAKGSESGLGFGYELLSALSRLKGGGEIKIRALGLLGERIGERLLDRVKELDPAVVRTAATSHGVFFVGVAEKPESTSGSASASAPLVGVQRSFRTADGLVHANFSLEHTGGELRIAWAAIEPETPTGVRVLADGVAFTFSSDEGCRGVRLVQREVLFERCPARLLDGTVVEERVALVDGIDELAPDATDIPRFYVRFGKRDRDRDRDLALALGLQLFAEGDFEGAASAFERATESIDPVAPYDASDLLFNRACALQALGRRSEALALFRSIGDVSYQHLVDERASQIESGR